MKWFFCLNDFGFPRYRKHVEAAVRSWKGDRQPICLFDGTEWGPIQDLGVQVVGRESRFKGALAKAYPIGPSIPGHVVRGKAEGAWLRLEIPDVCEELGIEDEFVLYTDVDVLFLKSPYPLLDLKPTFLAAGPQHDQNDWSWFNSGVMWMNVRACREEFPKAEPVFACDLEQGPMNKLLAGRWNRLSLEYNWKPYWGVNPDARIVHFHGPKPVDPPRGDVPPSWRDCEGWRHYAEMV